MTAVLRRSAAAAAVVVLGVAGVAASAASGGDRSGRFSAALEGYQEVPAVSTVAGGSFRAWADRSGTSVHWRLRYADLEAPVQQAHIHFGQESVNGGVSVFLCSNLGNGPAGTQPCPPSGTVEGTFTSAAVIGPSGQGIAAGELAELLAAMNAGVAYANVHSDKFPGGEVRGQIEDRRHGHR